LLPYNATKAGLILMPGGLFLMCLLPGVGFLVRKVQPKFLIFMGFILSAGALYHFTGLDTDASFGEIVVDRMYQTFGVAFLFVPIQTLAYACVPPGKSNNASALINLMRNLGGSVGISLGTTLLARRSQIHQDRLVSHLTATAPGFQHELHTLTQRYMAHGSGPVTSAQQALATVSQQLQQQSAMLAYLDIFVVLILCCLIAASGAAFLRTINLRNAQQLC
ncbi:MAG TPA: MFS transporter, partial [Candidatus Cybelea sp.]|nr:MFS transporter [Candidatus Cybelea sp.]